MERFIVLLAGSLIIGAFPAFAQSAGGVGDLGFDTFIGACAGNIGNRAAVLTYLRAHKFAPSPAAFAEGQFHTSADNVWLAPLPDMVAVVTSSDALTCRAYVRGGDTAKEAEFFSKVILGIARPEVFVRKVKEEDLTTQAGPTRYLAYRVGAVSPSPGVADRLFSITTTANAQAAFSTIMTAAAVKAASE